MTEAAAPAPAPEAVSAARSSAALSSQSCSSTSPLLALLLELLLLELLLLLLVVLLLELHSAALRGSMVPARKAPLVKTLRQPSLEAAHTFLSIGSSRWGVTRAVRQGGEEAE